jgi:Ni/Fe-hydrogenase 1 B-type cytochrome subunit
MFSYPLHLTPQTAKFGHKFVWELPIRLTHWVTAVAIVVLFSTGLYINWPVFSVQGEAAGNFLMGRFREIHFVAGYALLFSFILRGYWFFVGNKYSRSGVPLVWRKSWWHALREQVLEYFGTKRGSVRLGHNSLAGLSYVLFIGGLGVFQIITGFAMYGENNPGGLWDSLTGWVIPLLGGSYRARLWHHTAAWGFVIFLILHLYIVIFDSFRFRNGLINAMISGDKFYEEGDEDSDDWVS